MHEYFKTCTFVCAYARVSRREREREREGGREREICRERVAQGERARYAEGGREREIQRVGETYSLLNPSLKKTPYTVTRNKPNYICSETCCPEIDLSSEPEGSHNEHIVKEYREKGLSIFQPKPFFFVHLHMGYRICDGVMWIYFSRDVLGMWTAGKEDAGLASPVNICGCVIIK